MKRIVVGILCVFSAALAGKRIGGTYLPGSRTEVMAHNAYPDHGKYQDRLDRAIASGTPFAVEEDLAWIDGKSLIIHGAKNAANGDPTLESYFFPKVKPLIEQALLAGNKDNWPLVTLYLDIKNDPPEHLAAVKQTLGRYDTWMTSALKTDKLATQSPLDLKPMMVLVEDKAGEDNKRRAFYDEIPTGGKLYVFGSVSKPDPNPGRKLSKTEAVDRMASLDPEQIVSAKADNYHRWWGSDWAYIEKGGEEHAGDWTAEEDKRLQHWIRYGHRLGYFVGFYCFDGFTAADNQGWEDEYNFGSKSAVSARWTAVAAAHADFIATDQYEDLAHFLRSNH